MAFLFENLEVYKKAIAFADEISDLTEGFTKGNYYLVDELNRAALSVATNIAEGNGRYHKADRKNFFRISRGSAFECVPILELCKRKKLIEEEKYKVLKENLDEICKMLSGLINY
jgi:four helix bundle protein